MAKHGTTNWSNPLKSTNQVFIHLRNPQSAIRNPQFFLILA
jgi:hypothetical protein